MTFNSRNRFLDSSGVSMISLIAIVAVGALALVYMQLNGLLSKTASEKIRGSRATSALESAADTLLLSYRLAEQTYNIQMGACTSDTAKPFLQALFSGHGCTAGVTTVNVFRPSGPGVEGDARSMDISTFYDYSHKNGCTIEANAGLNCEGQFLATTQLKLITIGKGTAAYQNAQKIDGSIFEFTLNRVNAQKEIAEFSVGFQPKAGPAGTRNMAIRASLVNLAHIEADGRVTQEHPDPTAICKGTEWANFQLYDPDTKKCQDFSQIGGGTGLAYYKNRFFGFRPNDGVVVDLFAAASASSSYLVQPSDGTVCPGCKPIFPAYDPDALKDVDDITVVSDQIYYVAGEGPGATIGALSVKGDVQPEFPETPIAPPGTPTRVPLCRLGQIGWGQAYAGISGSDWSQPILPAPGVTPHQVSATFYLKTDTGSLLTATILSGAGTAPASFSGPQCTNFTFTGANYWSCCMIFKDDQLQVYEYSRSFGFERAAETKPYYLY